MSLPTHDRIDDLPVLEENHVVGAAGDLATIPVMEVYPVASRPLHCRFAPDRNHLFARHTRIDGARMRRGPWQVYRRLRGRSRGLALGRSSRLLFERGRQWIDENLFNGEYYEHEIRPPGEESQILPGLRHRKMGARDLKEPELQLGAGCLVDQLVGQYMAHVCGLGYLLDPKHVRTTLKNIMKYNFKEGLHNHFNHNRTFALNDESALLMATYPRGRRPKRPFPYYNEVMTGFEYTAAVHMLYEGQIEAGLKCIAAIRSRYDGRKRNPFNEAECGHHYARAMASWAAVLALTGFRYSGVEDAVEFTATREPSQFFWANGYAWGTCKQTPSRGKTKVALTVLQGSLKLKRFALSGLGAVEFPRPKLVPQGKTARLVVTKSR